WRKPYASKARLQVSNFPFNSSLDSPCGTISSAKSIHLGASSWMCSISTSKCDNCLIDILDGSRIIIKASYGWSSSRECVLPWMYNILVIHGHDAAEESVTHMLDMVYKITNSRGATLQSLLQLSGRLQLVTSQIDKASQRISHSVDDLETDESEDEDEFYHEDKDDASEINHEFPVVLFAADKDLEE
ncbi:WD40 repeat-containing protein SMU1, partial [Trifolium pratense]